MKKAGYNIFYDSNETNDIHFLHIPLPNIPDLERRLTSKYLSKLSSYNLNLKLGKNEVLLNNYNDTTKVKNNTLRPYESLVIAIE